MQESKRGSSQVVKRRTPLMRRKQPRRTNAMVVAGEARLPALRELRRLWDMPYIFIKQQPGYITIGSDPLAATLINVVYRLRDVASLVTLAANFQFYRFRFIDFVYRPLVTENVAVVGSGIGSTYVVPNIVFSDNHYSNVYTTYDAVAQRGDACVVQSTRQWAHRLFPTPLVRIFDTALVDGFANIGTQWISTAANDVPHYGFVIAIEPTTATPSPTFGGNIAVYYSVEFRNPISA